jgi:DNA alkylation repair enzyme
MGPEAAGEGGSGVRQSRFGREVRRCIVERADLAVMEGAERYFKNQLWFLGLNAPGIREVTREVEPLFEGRPISQVVGECFRLAFHRGPRRGTSAYWGACDHIAGRVLRPLVSTSPRWRKRIVSWRNAKSPWRQRVAAVAFVNEARHGRHNREILTICRALVRNPDRFVQLGMGWVLRELFLADREVVLDFLRQHYPSINREALRYAIEKMPKSLQSTILTEHASEGRGARAKG